MGYIGNQPAETPVVEILETDFKIGEDDQTKIDFADANTINFHANNAKEMVLVENSLSPGTSDGTALGTTSLMWSDIFLASGGVMNFNNGNVTVTHSSNTLTVAAATVAFTASTAVTVSNDLKLSSDSAILSLGADDDATLISRLVDGESPQYEKIIPDSNEIKIVVDSEKISGSLRRVSLFSNPKNRLLRVDVKNEGMRLSAKSPELGEAFETLDILSANSEIDIGFDAQYIKDALAHIAPGEILLEFKDALSAVTLRPVESEDHLCLIMPMRLDA